MTRQPSPEISSAVQRWHRLHWTSAFRAHEYREALLDLLAVSRARTFRELTDTLEFGLSEVHDAFRRNELALDDYLRQTTEAIEGLGTRGSRVWWIGGEERLHILNSDPSNAATRLNLSPERRDAWEAFWASVGQGRCSSPVLLLGEVDGGDVPDSLHRLLGIARCPVRTPSRELVSENGVDRMDGERGIWRVSDTTLVVARGPVSSDRPVALAAQITAAFVANSQQRRVPGRVCRQAVHLRWISRAEIRVDHSLSFRAVEAPSRNGPCRATPSPLMTKHRSFTGRSRGPFLWGQRRLGEVASAGVLGSA